MGSLYVLACTKCPLYTKSGLWMVVKQWIVINGYNRDEMKTSIGEAAAPLQWEGPDEGAWASSSDASWTSSW